MSESAAPRRLVVLLWDAAAAHWAERFLDEGVLPALARLAARGTRFAARPAWPCAQTPPGMATVLTGAPTHVHEIYGYREQARPRERHPATATATGFDARRLRAEPLWTTAARAGRSSAVAFCPLASPHEAYAPGGPWDVGRPPATLDGYGAVLAGQHVHTRADLTPVESPPPPPAVGDLDELRGWKVVLPLASGDAPRELVLGLGRRRGARAFDRAWVAAPGAATSRELAIGDAGPGLAIDLGASTGVVLFLFEVAPDGRDVVLWRSGIWRLRGGDGTPPGPAYAAMGPFLGGGAGGAYREGALGPGVRDGGDGTAERHYLTALRASSDAFARGSVHVLQESKADAVFLYEPCIDETAHIFEDLAEAALRGQSGAATAGLSVLRDAYRLADAHLERVLEAAGDDAIVAVAADHGQQAVKAIFRPNAVLARAGLVALDGEGKIDLARSQVFYGLAGNGYLVVNGVDRPQGIVPLESAAAVLRRAIETLREWRAPDGYHPIVAALWPDEEHPRGRVPGREAGDACVLAAPNVTLGVSGTGAPLEPGHGGQHTTAGDEPELDALFVVGGPGVPRHGRWPERVENLDVAPTLARLAGLPPPREATGRALLG